MCRVDLNLAICKPKSALPICRIYRSTAPPPPSACRGDLNTGRPRLAIAFACPALLSLSGDYDELTLMHEFTHSLVVWE